MLIFISGLDLNTLYDITAIFSKAGIIPGNGYTGNELIDILQEALGKRPGEIFNDNFYKYLI